MSPKKLANMNEDEFMDAWSAAADDLESAKEKVKEFAAEAESRAVEEKTDNVLASLNSKELAALAQRIETEGIETEETVGSDQ